MKDSLLVIVRGKLKGSTKWLTTAIVVFPILMQRDDVKNYVTPLAAAHPKLATAIGALTLLGTLMHTPVVQAIFARPDALTDASEQAKARRAELAVDASSSPLTDRE